MQYFSIRSMYMFIFFRLKLGRLKIKVLCMNWFKQVVDTLESSGYKLLYVVNYSPSHALIYVALLFLSCLFLTSWTYYQFTLRSQNSLFLYIYLTLFLSPSHPLSRSPFFSLFTLLPTRYFNLYIIYLSLLEVKLPHVPVCPSVASVGRMVCRSVGR